MKFAGVVVLYNPDSKIIDNIESYLKYLDKLYIVDNSAECCNCLKNIREDLNSYQIEYIWMGENVGIAKAINVAAQRALQEKYEWLLTMDQDSSFKTNILNIYSEFILKNRRDDVAILSPLYLTDRKCDIAKGKYESVYWTMQSANLVNLNIYSEVGGFNESYFIDCVDYEYCLRVKKNGYAIVRCNEAILNHNPAITREICIFRKKYKYGYASPIRIYYQVRNALYMFRKYHNIHSIQIVIIKFAKILILFDNKKMFLNYFFMAMNDCMKNISGKKEI